MSAPATVVRCTCGRLILDAPGGPISALLAHNLEAHARRPIPRVIEPEPAR